MTDIKIGDKVVMNSNYLVGEIHKGRIWTVCSEPWYCYRTLVVKLEGWFGGYAVDGLNLVEEIEEEKMSEIKLKPCPFCGNRVLLARDNYGKYLIECENCSLLFGIRVENGTELVDGWRATINTIEEATKLWNRRADNA